MDREEAIPWTTGRARGSGFNGARSRGPGRGTGSAGCTTRLGSLQRGPVTWTGKRARRRSGCSTSRSSFNGARSRGPGRGEHLTAQRHASGASTGPGHVDREEVARCWSSLPISSTLQRGPVTWTGKRAANPMVVWASIPRLQRGPVTWTGKRARGHGADALDVVASTGPGHVDREEVTDDSVWYTLAMLQRGPVTWTGKRGLHRSRPRLRGDASTGPGHVDREEGRPCYDLPDVE